jgi:RNA polymerase sigma-B factor
MSAAVGAGAAIRPLPAQRDCELVARWRAGDSRAREQLVQRLTPLARRLARRYARSASDVEDLEQVANIGLLKAIDRFDPARGVLLSTYAWSIMAGELGRWLRDGCWGVKVTRPVKELAARIDAALPGLTARLGRSPALAEIASAVGSDNEAVLMALQARSAAAIASLDEMAASGDTRVANLAPGAEEPGFERAEHRAVLEPALRALPGRERLVLDLRFGEDMSQSEIAEGLGVSQMQVSRILRRALERIAGAV